MVDKIRAITLKTPGKRNWCRPAGRREIQTGLFVGDLQAGMKTLGRSKLCA